MKNNRLYVGNLAWSVSEDMLRTLFADQGPVTEVKMIMDRETGRSRGFAFVTYESNEAAEKAIQALNGNMFEGRPLRVNVAEERNDRGGGGGRPGGGNRFGGGGDRGGDRGGRGGGDRFGGDRGGEGYDRGGRGNRFGGDRGNRRDDR